MIFVLFIVFTILYTLSYLKESRKVKRFDQNVQNFQITSKYSSCKQRTVGFREQNLMQRRMRNIWARWAQFSKTSCFLQQITSRKNGNIFEVGERRNYISTFWKLYVSPELFTNSSSLHICSFVLKATTSNVFLTFSQQKCPQIFHGQVY